MWGRTVRVGLAAIVLAVLSNGPVFFVQARLFHQGPGFETPWARAWFTSVGFLGVALLGHHVAVTRRVPTRRGAVGLALVGSFLLFAVASATWSVAPDLTMRRSLVYVGIGCFGVWFGSALTRREQLFAVAIGFQACVIASAAVLTLHVPGVLQEGNHRWKGIYTNSNSLGPVVGIAALSVAAVALLGAGRLRRLCWALFAGDLVVLGFAVSMTAISAFALSAIASLLLVRAHRARAAGVSARRLSALLIGGVAAAGVALTEALPLVGSVLRGDPTLSHRTHIWAEVWSMVKVHPVRGYGFFAFWDRFDLAAPLYWDVGLVFGSAHNSVLETALGLGAVGVLLYVGTVVLAAQTAVARWWWSPSIVTGWWVALTVFLFVESMSESFVLWYSYHWPFLVAAVTAPALFPLRRRPFATVVVRSQGRRPRGLAAALASLRDQTSADFEVVVVAHGGRAERAAVRSIVRSAPGLRCTVVVCRRPGRGAPLNTGIDVARGRFVVFLDDDDLVRPNWISAFAEAAVKVHPAVLRAQAHVQQWSATPDGDPIEPIGPLESPYPARFDLREHIESNRTPICAMALPLDLVKGHDIRADETLKVLEDFDLLMSVALFAPVIDIAEHTSLVRRHDGENSLRLHEQDEWDSTYHAVVRRLSAEAVASPKKPVDLLRFGP